MSDTIVDIRCSSHWSKEDKLHELKNELATIDRKIQLSIAPSENIKVEEHEEYEKAEVKNAKTPMKFKVM